MILCVKHVNIEGPETIGKFFREKGFKIKILELYRNHPFPKRVDGLRAVIVLGGPMNVYQEDQYPWLKDENIFIKQVLKKRIPYLGICLGAQLLAKACQASVVKSPSTEIGFSQIFLTDPGKKDHIFRGLEPEFDVYQWHEDMFEIPRRGKLLASSQKCPYQAFKVGTCAYGFQFHVEVTDKSIRDWSHAVIRRGDVKFKAQKVRMLRDYKNKKIEFNQTAKTIYNNFLTIMNQTHQKSN